MVLCFFATFCFFRENLERLLDDKHFKDEIVHFNISEEGTVVLDMHRPQLIPILMRCVWDVHFLVKYSVKSSVVNGVCGLPWCRILYGRMRTKVGNKFQGKAATASRSSIVLRFLAGCQPEELGMFIDLLLEPVCHHSQGTHTHT